MTSWSDALAAQREIEEVLEDELRPRESLMPVISMWMPWANWVSLGWKPIETRLHKRFASLVGKRIGIHCSLKWDETAIEQARPFLTFPQVLQTQRMLHIGGAIICTALVKEFRQLNWDDSRKALIDCDFTKRYGLILEDVQTIEAIPCKGRQGIWYVPSPPIPAPQKEKQT